jgi:hypothetical protein
MKEASKYILGLSEGMHGDFNPIVRFLDRNIDIFLDLKQVMWVSSNFQIL